MSSRSRGGGVAERSARDSNLVRLQAAGKGGRPQRRRPRWSGCSPVRGPCRCGSRAHGRPREARRTIMRMTEIRARRGLPGPVLGEDLAVGEGRERAAGRSIRPGVRRFRSQERHGVPWRIRFLCLFGDYFANYGVPPEFGSLSNMLIPREVFNRVDHAYGW